MITLAQVGLPPNLLLGFCESSDEWYKFTADPNNPDAKLCPDCGNKPSSKIGFQVTTQRSFDATAKKISKAKLKKMGMGA